MARVLRFLPLVQLFRCLPLHRSRQEGWRRQVSPVAEAADPFAVLSPAWPTGSVADERNLIWSCQIFTVLLYLDRATPPERIASHAAAAGGKQKASRLRHVAGWRWRPPLRPLPPKGAIPSSDLLLVQLSFAAKYPALVTGFFFFMCFVSVIHLLVGLLYCLVSWSVGLPKRNPIDLNLLKLLIPVAVCHALGRVTSNVSFDTVAVAFTHTIKALEPFFNAAASQFILGQQIPLTLWLLLAVVVIDTVSMASLTELSFNWTDFISAMISNVSFTYRSSFFYESHGYFIEMDNTNIYAYISIIALFVCIPPTILDDKPSVVKCQVCNLIIDRFAMKIVCFLTQDDQQVATNTLERVAPLTQAVGNVLKRVFLIGFLIIIFGMSRHRGTRFQHRQALALALPLLVLPSTSILRQRWKRRKEYVFLHNAT
ncbi:hypothetical protein ZIOFF_066052 [Zingiber officinale]|uniref:Sugar phosphate transporter domain-containing protein n=1 Tax=Zingiber officinale TaxID=94328 RepID=A0A8J5K7E0_ZINOF|nr:hypothetical protein ZIOFF_066052 [Zingiber officinale]